MIGYVTLGTNNIERACAFFDELFSSIGVGRAMETETFVAWAQSPDSPAISITKPYNGEAATAGNGVMVALKMNSQEEVDAFHKKALTLGATNEGSPGFRPEDATSGYYGAYFRDLDGNKLNAFCFL